MAKIAAAQVAEYVRRRLPIGDRGAFLLQLSEGGEVVIAVFGNEREPIDDDVAREVELVREAVKGLELKETDLDASPDGHAWALLVEVAVPYRTAAGLWFRAEMGREELHEAATQAWSSVRGREKRRPPSGRPATPGRHRLLSEPEA